MIALSRRKATVRPWKATALADLPRPMFITHRGGGATGYGPYPENTPALMASLLAAGAKIINYDGNALLSDGNIAGLHDSTVDRTTNGTGATTTFTTAAYTALFLDPVKSWGPGYPQLTYPAPLMTDHIDALMFRGVHVPEAGVASTIPTMAAYFISRGLKDHVQIQSSTLANAVAAVAAGLSGCYLASDTRTLAQVQAEWANTQGPVGLNYYGAAPEGGSIDARIQLFVAAGYRVQVFSINRRSDALDAIASAVTAGGVLDAVISNDPIYHDTRIWVPRTTDSFSTGRWGHGFVAGAGGGVPRAIFTGTTPNRVGWNRTNPTAGVGSFFLLGEICPLPSTFTMDLNITCDGVSNGATSYFGVGFCTTTDRNFSNSPGSTRLNGYFLRLNQSGLLTLFKNTAAGATQTTLGTPVGSTAIVTGQTVPVRITVTATTVTIKRVDTNDTVTVTDSTYRSGYVFLGKTGGSATAFTDGVLVSASPTVTSATAAFSATTDVGKLITGTGIPTGTVINSVESATSATMSSNATASGNPVTINVGRPNLYATFDSITVT